KKRQSEELGRESAKNPRIEVFDVDNSSTMITESSHPEFSIYNNLMNLNYNTNDVVMINAPYYSQKPYVKLDIDKGQILGVERTTVEGVSSVAKSFSAFAPFITSFLDIGTE